MWRHYTLHDPNEGKVVFRVKKVIRNDNMSCIGTESLTGADDASSLDLNGINVRKTDIA